MLKLIAILTMLIDHVGMVLFPQYPLLRIIGRLSFVLFAYQLTIGYIHTSNLKKYATRLLAFAIISQPIYMLLVPYQLNIFFTLLLGILGMLIWDKGKFPVWAKAILCLAVCAVGWGLSVSYGAYGVALPILFYVFKDKKIYAMIGQFVATLLYCVVGKENVLQVYSVMALYLIYGWDLTSKLKIHINRYVFYWFYPVHLGLIYLTKIFVVKA